MTGYTVNTGATTKFSQNWDRIFGAAAGAAAKKTAKGSQPKAAKAVEKAPAKKGAKKAAPKAGAAKTVRSKQAAQTALTSGKR